MTDVIFGHTPVWLRLILSPGEDFSQPLTLAGGWGDRVLTLEFGDKDSTILTAGVSEDGLTATFTLAADVSIDEGTSVVLVCTQAGLRRFWATGVVVGP